MAYRRRRVLRRRPTRRPMRRRRARRVPRPIRGAQVVHRHFRWTSTENDTVLTLPNAVTTTPGTAATALVYRLNQIGGIGEFQALYDQYKITRVYLRISFDVNAVQGVDGVGPTSFPVNQAVWAGPEMYIMNDYDDAAVASVDVIRQSARSKMVRFTPNRSTVRWKCRPRPSIGMQVDDPGIVTSMVPQRAPWLDMSRVDVDHYATKMAFLNFNPNATAIRITVGYAFLCRGTR